MLQAIKSYLLGSYAEMKKVTWPPKQQTINYSLVVLGLSVFMAAFFAILDYIFSLGISQIISR